MKIIVATSETQGQKPGDFNFVPDGEIVVVSDCDCLHAGCDCVRSMVGINSGKGTTTMKVVESEIMLEEYRRLIVEASQGYSEFGVDDDISNEQADALLDLARQFPAGAVIERDGEDFKPRPASA
jgi:hypothetical protein